jgi:autotransporter-associated beta strand protein
VTFNSGLASSNAAGLTVLGGGLLSLAGSNLYTGTTTISSGTLAISGGGLLGANGNSSSPIVNNGLLAVNTSSNQTFSGAISGTGSFQQLGSNVTTLSSANTFTGTTRVTGGTLRREPNWRVN